MNLGVFLPNWVGDVVMAGPALRALKQYFGRRARLIGIMRPYVADVLTGTGWLDEALFYDPRSKDRRLRAVSLVRQLRKRRLDLAVLLTNSLRTGLLAYASGARQRVGYVRYGRGPLLTRRLEPPRTGGQLAPHAMVDYYLELAYSVGCPPQSPRLELATLPADEQAADTVWEKFSLRSGRVVALNSSGAFGAAKLWPPEHFAVLGRMIATEMDHDVLVLCGPSEREIAREVVRQAGHPRVVSLAEEPLGIGLSKACIRRSRLMVTTDSGPRHFAIAFDVPVIGLYGPTSPIWGENRAARAVHLQLALDCSGCHERVCPLEHHRCMRDLKVSQVYRAVTAQLEKPHESAA